MKPPPPPILGEPDGKSNGQHHPSRGQFRLPQYWGRGGLLLLFLFLLALPLHARPQALVILADHLTLSDVTRPDLLNLTRMRQQGELALMSPGLARKPDPVAAAYATLGAGDTVGVGDVSQGRMGGALRRAGVRAALVGDADGDDTGSYRPARLLLPDPDMVSDGAVADPLAPGGKREDPSRLWAATESAFRTCDLVVVHFGDFARAERENQRGFLLPSAYASHRQRALLALDEFLGLALPSVQQMPGRRLLLIVPTPPMGADDSWSQLTPFLASTVPPDPRYASELDSDSHPVAQSPTTQTWGLVATRDVAPTLLSALNVPVPVQMTGAPIVQAGTPAADDEVLPRLRRMDSLTRLNQEAQNPIFWTVGIGAGIIVFGCLGLYLTGRMSGRTGITARYSLRLVSAWPLALLFAPLVGVHTVSAYVAVFVGLTGLVALLPTPPLICALTALVIVGDGLTGTTLISNSALSEYALSGIRFYGIGNEYMGVLIGGALLACVAVPPAPNNGGAGGGTGAKSFLTPPLLGAGGTALLWFALIVFVLSFPAFGAKAGGAVTATATFVVAWRRLRGLPVNWKHLAGSVAAGFALVFLWAVLSHVLHLRRTHLETAADALGQGRFGYIVGVSLRKIGLAARVAVHPGTLLGLLAFALLALAARRFLWRQIAAYLHHDPNFAAVWGAGLWGCVVAVLFNDSGIVAAILMLQCLVLSLLHAVFLEKQNAPARP